MYWITVEKCHNFEMYSLNINSSKVERWCGDTHLGKLQCCAGYLTVIKHMQSVCYVLMVLSCMFAVLAGDLDLFTLMSATLWQSPRLDRMAYWEECCNLLKKFHLELNDMARFTGNCHVHHPFIPPWGLGWRQVNSTKNIFAKLKKCLALDRQIIFHTAALHGMGVNLQKIFLFAWNFN